MSERYGRPSCDQIDNDNDMLHPHPPGANAAERVLLCVRSYWESRTYGGHIDYVANVAEERNDHIWGVIV